MDTTTLIAKYDGRVPRYTSYPTAPHFHAGIGAQAYARWLMALDPAEALSLYVHVPFCDTLCWFCGCHTTVVRKTEPVAHYQNLLLREIDLVAGHLSGRRRVRHLHLGGGSPTILSPARIDALFERLRARFDFAGVDEIAVEIDPRGIQEATIAALARAGMNRASIGVQDLDARVQAAVNRRQPFETTRRCVELLRAHGVAGVNVDLMYGLPHQTVAGTRATLARILQLAPERVAIFGYAHVPWMKRHQRLIDEAALPDASARLAQAEAAAELLEAAGYVRVGMDHFSRPEDGLARALRAGTLRRNFQGYTTDTAPALLGLGASAIGRLPDGYVQNATSLRDYGAAIAAGRLPVARGVATTAEQRMRAEVIERLMCDMHVDLAAVAARHGVDLAVLYPAWDRLRAMEADRLIRVDGACITVYPHARTFLRVVASAFDADLLAGGTRHAKAV